MSYVNTNRLPASVTPGGQLRDFEIFDPAADAYSVVSGMKEQQARIERIEADARMTKFLTSGVAAGMVATLGLMLWRGGK